MQDGKAGYCSPLSTAHAHPSKKASASRSRRDSGHLLCDAARTDDLETVQQLLDKGHNPNATKNGRNPLHYASFFGYVEKINALIDKGANVHAKCENESNLGWTALHCAADSGRASAVKALVAAGADIHTKTSMGETYGWTALYFAVNSGHTDVVEALVATGADICTKTSKGEDSYDLARKVCKRARLYDLLNVYNDRRKKEVTTLLELGLWKAEMRRSSGTAPWTRATCRVICNADVIIPTVVPFL